MTYRLVTVLAVATLRFPFADADDDVGGGWLESGKVDGCTRVMFIRAAQLRYGKSHTPELT